MVFKSRFILIHHAHNFIFISFFQSDYASKLRLRIRPSKTNEILPKHYNSNKHSAKFSPPISSSHFTGAMFAMIFVFFIIVEMEKWLPTPLMLEDEVNNPGRFIAERAKNHLYNLTSMGPRPVGSVENEILAVDFLKKEINSIISKSIPLHRISIDLQKTSGAFPLEFLDGLTNVYKNVQNVIVKIGPVEESEHSMLINCHIDTVPDSPGKFLLSIFLFPSFQVSQCVRNNFLFPPPPSHNSFHVFKLFKCPLKVLFLSFFLRRSFTKFL